MLVKQRPPAPKRPRWLTNSTLRRKTREEKEAYRRAHLGEFIAIPLRSGFAFARYRGVSGFAFYDFHAPQIAAIDEIKRHPILFTLYCNSERLAKGVWKVIGQEPLEPELAVEERSVRHSHGSESVHIYYDGKFWPYAGEDLTKLEPCAVWDTPEQVEERLRLHFIGRPYPWSERQKVPLELAERLYREYWAKHGGEKRR
ncbi:MAG: hypothetical protein JNM30_08710 [Rhodospirillales bacterium]|nr:hypothetical protein [Rhodospirillales bacterium]